MQPSYYLTAQEIEDAEAQAVYIVRSTSEPVLWSIVAELGFVDRVGGDEYELFMRQRLTPLRRINRDYPQPVGSIIRR